jgi:hypothetical protein
LAEGRGERMGGVVHHEGKAKGKGKEKEGECTGIRGAA